MHPPDRTCNHQAVHLTTPQLDSLSTTSTTDAVQILLDPPPHYRQPFTLSPGIMGSTIDSMKTGTVNSSAMWNSWRQAASSSACCAAPLPPWVSSIRSASNPAAVTASMNARGPVVVGLNHTYTTARGGRTARSCLVGSGRWMFCGADSSVASNSAGNHKATNTPPSQTPATPT